MRKLRKNNNCLQYLFVDDHTALDFDYLDTKGKSTNTFFIRGEKIDVGGDETISLEFIQCSDDFGNLNRAGFEVFRKGWMTWGNNSCEKRNLSNTLGNKL